MEERIFVQIAAYRDPELGSTVADCIAKASLPERLRFGVCVQAASGDPDSLGHWRGDTRVRAVDRPAAESEGVGWARAQVARLYRGEEFTLQVDAHTRFAEGWDAALVEMLSALPSERAILTAYPPAYHKLGGDRCKLSEARPHGIVCGGFDADGLPELRQSPLPRRELAAGPRPGFFLAAGFLFAGGSFVEDVPYDPEIYFQGEEISMALRAFTCGYDIYHPGRNLVWHLYARDRQPRHWSDPVEAGSWERLHRRSLDRLRNLLTGDAAALGEFGLGRVRSRQDFEAAAGLRFATASPGDGPSPTRAAVTVCSDGEPGAGPPKVAFLFLTRGEHNLPGIWEEYLRGGEGRYSIYAHAADPGGLGRGLIGDHLIDRQFRTRWGDVSLVEVTVALLRAALEDPANAKFVLVSESCVPVRPFPIAYSELVGDPRGIAKFWSYRDAVRVHPGRAARVESVPGVPGESWYSHRQWLALGRAHAGSLTDLPRFRMYRRCLAPDESYLLTELACRGFAIEEEFRNSALTYTRRLRSTDPHPVTFSDVPAADAAEIAGSGCLFARKFAPTSDIGGYGLHVGPGRSG